MAKSVKSGGNVILFSLAFSLLSPLAWTNAAANAEPAAASAVSAADAPVVPGAPVAAPAPTATPVPAAAPAPTAAAVPASSAPAAESADNKDADNGADKKHKKSADKAEKRSKVNKSGMSDYQMRHQDEGYYGHVESPKSGQSDSQQRHSEDGYYSDVKMVPAYVPPVETKVEPVNVPAPVVVPVVPRPVPSGPERKFGDDTGTKGSITFTRHVTTAKEMLNTGHPDIARRHFQDALKMFPEEVDLYQPLYESCSQVNDWSGAAGALEKLFELKPAKQKDLEWAYGQTQYELRKYDKAVPSLKKAASYGTHGEQVHRTLLKIAQQQNNNADILAEYAALLKVKNDYNTQLEFANYLERTGKHGDAIGHYKAAVNIQATDGPLMARLAYMLMFYNKDYTGAISFYNRAMQIDPANGNNYQQNIAYAQQQLDLSNKAKKKTPAQ